MACSKLDVLAAVAECIELPKYHPLRLVTARYLLRITMTPAQELSFLRRRALASVTSISAIQALKNKMSSFERSWKANGGANTHVYRLVLVHDHDQVHEVLFQSPGCKRPLKTLTSVVLHRIGGIFSATCVLIVLK
jgi:hypothetical protein